MGHTVYLVLPRKSHQSRPPKRRMYSPMPFSAVPGTAQLLWTLTVTAYLAASLSVWPLKARLRAAAHCVRSALACSGVLRRVLSVLIWRCELHCSNLWHAHLLLQVCWPLVTLARNLQVWQCPAPYVCEDCSQFACGIDAIAQDNERKESAGMHCFGLGQSKYSSSPRHCNLLAWKHPACTCRRCSPAVSHNFSAPRQLFFTQSNLQG